MEVITMKTIVPFLFVIGLFAMEPDDQRLIPPRVPSPNSWTRIAFKEKLIVDLMQVTGLTKDDISGLKAKYNNEIQTIAQWITKLPLDASTWTEFYVNTVNQYYSAKIKRDLTPIFGRRAMEYYELKGAESVNELKERIMLLEFLCETKKILKLSFSKDDSGQLKADKKSMLELAKDWLEKQLQKDHDRKENRKRANFRVSGIDIIEIVKSYTGLQSDASKEAETFKKYLKHINDQLQKYKEQNEKERLEEAECPICLDSINDVNEDNRCQFACCGNFICKDCLDDYNEKLCPICRKKGYK